MNGWWDVQSVNIAAGSPNRNEIQVGLVKETTLAPTQTRIVPITLTQKAALSGAELDLQIVVRSHDMPYPRQTIPVKVTLNRVSMWDAAPYGNPIIATPHWSSWSFPPDTSVVLVGHSNGGQGAWHIASRYPDRVISAVPAAAYVKSQAYVPLIQSRGADENVPVWHSRALIDVLKTWNPDGNVKFREDPGKRHWYPEVFNNTPVQEFINQTIRDFDENAGKAPSRKFTLTVAVPSESGSLHGWRIESLRVPGRLARMTVEIREHQILIDSRNTHMFSVSRRAYGQLFEDDATTLIVDGQQLALAMDESYARHEAIFFVRNQETWEAQIELQAEQRQIWGRMSLVLNSRAPILFVIPDRSDLGSLNAVLRLSHSLDVYHKLDASIIDAEEATNMLLQGSLPSDQNIVVLGGTKNTFTKQSLVHSTARFHLRDGILYLRDQPLSSSSSALFLSPHPTSSTALVLFIFANDEAGLERALRLFPIRTGVTVPDWIVLSPDADSRGEGGVDAAGVWGVNWSWNEGMSSF
ncbi:hypothetical protein EIP86_011493 [Pleurotus ostreatoroseus]|nr:hypothetical protein EIP86_011493 [Pleurotus ostreatoroseus]